MKNTGMNEDWEIRVQKLAKAFPYPPTPELAMSRPRRRPVSLIRLAQVAAILLLALIGLLAVPEIRAQVAAFFHIGAVEIVVTTATQPAPPPAPPPATARAHFAPDGDLPASVLDFPGATTLDDARRHVSYPVLLPSALAAPDRVYLIDSLHPVVVLAWLDANGAVADSLQLLPQDDYILKQYNGIPQPTTVGGVDAFWLPNPHAYMFNAGSDGFRMREVSLPALVWQAADGITYRFETHRSLDDARRIAESIPTPSPSGNG